MALKRTLATAVIVGSLALPLSLSAPAGAVTVGPQSPTGNATITTARESRAQTVSATDALEAETARVAKYRRALNAELKSHYLDRVEAAQTVWLKARKTLRKRSARMAAKKRYVAAQKAAKAEYDAGRDRVANQARSDVANAAKEYELAVTLANQTYDSEVAALKSTYSKRESEITAEATKRQNDIDTYFTELMIAVKTDAEYFRVAGEWKEALDVAWSDYVAARDANEAEYYPGLWETTRKYRETVGSGASCSRFPQLCKLKMQV